MRRKLIILCICLNFIIIIFVNQLYILSIGLLIGTLILLYEDKVLIVFFAFVLIFTSISFFLKTQYLEGECEFTGKIKFESIIYDNQIYVNLDNNRIIKLNNVNKVLNDGQSVKVQGFVKFIEGEYTNYYRGKNIFYEMKVENLIIIDSKVSIRASILNKIKVHLNSRFGNVGNLIFSMIFGIKKVLNYDEIIAFSVLGLTHLLVVSGFHVSIISQSFDSILIKIKIYYYIRKALVLIGLFFLAFLSGFHVSVIRAVLQKVIKEIGTVLNKKYDSVSALAIISIVLIIVNPYYVVSKSYQLSFIAAFSLANIREITHILRVYIGIFPIILIMNNNFNVLTLFVNILMLIALSVLLPLSILLSFSPINLGIANEVLVWIFNGIVEILDKLASLEILNIVIMQPSKIHIALYYSIFFLLFVLKEEKKINEIIIKWKYICILIVLIGFLFFNRQYRNFFDDSVIFIDVGNGDSALISCQGEHILIDAGRNDSLAKMLSSLWIDDIEAAFISHAHFDHYNGLKYCDNIKINTIFMNNYTVLNQAKILYNQIEDIYKGECYIFGDVEIRLLWPNKNTTYDENDQSQVIIVNFKGIKFLFTGDISQRIEEKIRINSIDVLKVAHHGSLTSSSEIFLERINPKVSVISVGEKNSYGHPDIDIVKRLEDISDYVFITKDCGSILLKIKDDSIKYKFMELSL